MSKIFLFFLALFFTSYTGKEPQVSLVENLFVVAQIIFDNSITCNVEALLRDKKLLISEGKSKLLECEKTINVIKKKYLPLFGPLEIKYIRSSDEQKVYIAALEKRDALFKALSLIK